MPAVDRIIISLSAVSAVAFLGQVQAPPSPKRALVKTSSTALLALLALFRGGPALGVIALALGSIGDWCLAFDGEAAFLGGLTHFLMAHLFYIRLFSQMAARPGTELAYGLVPVAGWQAQAAAALGVLVVGMIGALVPRVPGGLRVPIVIYSTAIFAMVLTALAVDNDRILAGALLFTTSDALLAANQFLVGPKSSHRGWMQHSVWVSYYTAQLLIALEF
ncbi:YhhN-like protein [Lasiosphaeris hirsuta]|uniref:YhhN-like protein n=1 Tax=Lasiosphaeris hirsuta TaxID=260670 RepID=A0AA40DPE9_9PEZI|nr:YhhN-like protein [Lasiosphaeris hirsuta]